MCASADIHSVYCKKWPLNFREMAFFFLYRPVLVQCACQQCTLDWNSIQSVRVFFFPIPLLPWCAAACCVGSPGRRRSRTSRHAVGMRWSGARWNARRRWPARSGPQRTLRWRWRPRWRYAGCGEEGRTPCFAGAPWYPSRWRAGTPAGSSAGTGPVDEDDITHWGVSVSLSF